MTTAAQLIHKTRGYVLRGHRQEVNLLLTSVNSSTTTFALTDALGGITAGSRLSVDLETVYVRTVDETAKTATVVRGWDGSTAASHNANALVYVDPVVTDAEILEAVNDDLADLSANGLFRVRTKDVTYNAAVNGYDLAAVTDLVDVISVRYKATGPEKDWPHVPFHLERDLPTTEFSSGIAIYVDGTAQPGNTVRVQYKAPYASLAATTDVVETAAGLHAQATDIPPLGAAARLISLMEAGRNLFDTQGQPRRAEEVPPGAVASSARPSLAFRQRRIDTEARRLAAMYPVRTKRWA